MVDVVVNLADKRHLVGLVVADADTGLYRDGRVSSCAIENEVRFKRHPICQNHLTGTPAFDLGVIVHGQRIGCIECIDPNDRQ